MYIAGALGNEAKNVPTMMSWLRGRLKRLTCQNGQGMASMRKRQHDTMMPDIMNAQLQLNRTSTSRELADTNWLTGWLKGGRAFSSIGDKQ